jgi:AraC-like DNA-binding protein
MVMGQRTKSYFIEPVGHVNSFAICFYPYGFANFAGMHLNDLVDTEVSIKKVFGTDGGSKLEEQILSAKNTQERITVIETFLLNKLQEEETVENLVKNTIDALMSSNGSTTILHLMQGNKSKRRQLERNFKKQIGISPKQLGRILRLQTALNMLLNQHESKTAIAYESQYFDQAHFIKDFKAFIGTTPKEFAHHENMALSTLFYQ